MTTDLEVIQSQRFELDTLNNISEELLWLQNFPSKFTKRTYHDAVKKFCNLFEIKNLQDLTTVQSIHVIRFRDMMKEAGEKNATRAFSNIRVKRYGFNHNL